LQPGEAFNIVDYSDRVESFARRAVVKDASTIVAARRYLAGLTTGGGTNIEGALAAALAPEPLARHLPLVLFLTDGLPTVGVKDEVTLKERALAANEHDRRLFTFGVGFDVNVPLLDRLADSSRAKSTYVLPGEDVEVAVGQVFRRLAGPTLTNLAMEVRDSSGGETVRSFRDVYPERLPDLFEGDQLVLLGRYTDGNASVRVVLSGDQGDDRKRFGVDFDLAKATRRNDFVPRLWAARRIAALMDEIRQAGADPRAALAMQDDPRWSELAEEVLTLSTKHGVLSEYTAFLALEGTDLGDWAGMNAIAVGNLIERGAHTRSGGAAVNQGRNWNELRDNSRLAYDNGYWDAGNRRVSMVDVQPLADRVLFRRGERWVDGHALGAAAAPEPDEEIDFGSAAHAALVRELAETRRGGLLSLPGEVLLRLDGRNVLVRNGATDGADAVQR
jgi:Ca-activated chloride channel family protein